MIRISIGIKERGLRALKATGHGLTGKPGDDLLCASVSILLRSAAMGIESIPGIKIAGGSPEEGHLSLKIQELPEKYSDEVRGITRSLLIGLQGLADDYPNNLSIEVIEEK